MNSSELVPERHYLFSDPISKKLIGVTFHKRKGARFQFCYTDYEMYPSPKHYFLLHQDELNLLQEKKLYVPPSRAKTTIRK